MVRGQPVTRPESPSPTTSNESTNHRTTEIPKGHDRHHGATPISGPPPRIRYGGQCREVGQVELSRAVVTSGITGRVEGRAIKITDSECGSMNVKGGEWKERVNASSTNVISRVEREIQFVCVFAGRSCSNDNINERRKHRQLTCPTNWHASQIPRRMQRKRDILVIEESQRRFVEKQTEIEWENEARRDEQPDSPTKYTRMINPKSSPPSVNHPATLTTQTKSHRSCRISPRTE